jgi:hypothetical protein
MRRFGLLAMLLSLAVHAAFVLLLWLLPGGEDRPDGIAPGDFRLVVLGDPPEEKGPPPPVHPPPVPILIDPPSVAPGPPVPPAAGPIVRGVPGTMTTTAPPAPAAPRPGFLPTEQPGRSVVYLLDRSISMGLSGTLSPARRELRACLESLPPTCRFQVIPYSVQAEPLLLRGRQDLVPAEPDVVQAALARVESLPAAGGTYHARALQRGLFLRPDVIYLITDNLDLPDGSVSELTRQNQGRTRIHVLELVRTNQSLAGIAPTLLTERNQGHYRRVVLP